MRARWHQSILVRAGLALLALLLLFGAISVGINLIYNQARAEQTTEERLSQLLDTVESTASIACFTQDEILAQELISGLLRNSEVLAVAVEADNQPLAHLSRSPSEDISVSANTAAGNLDDQILVREIYSPFSPQMRVGRILLTPNQALIKANLQRETRIAMLQTALQTLLAMLAFAAAILMLIIRPITAISDRLHRMNAAEGERIPIPAGHQGSEIGLLVQDVNRLADRLVETLEEERRLRIQHAVDEQRYHAIFNNAETGLFIIDDRGYLSSWNPAFARLMELPPEAETLAQRSLFELAWSEQGRFTELLLGCIDTDQSRSAELGYRLKDDSQRWLSMVLTPIADESIQGVIYDVTQHLEAERSAKRSAVTDRATGLANQLGLEQQAKELAQACDLHEGGGFALVLLNLDNFTRISEGLDPVASNAILQEAAKRLCSNVKGSDLVARISECQFALLLAEIQRALDVEHIMERALHALQQPLVVASSTVKLQVSEGIALYPQDTNASITTLIQHANLALSHGGSGQLRRMRFFNPGLARLAEDRYRLETALHQAIELDQFVLFYQPIVDIAQGRLVGAEALIRWKHPQRGLVPPDSFIPLAEETGFINEMGLWVLEQAGHQLAAWKRAGLERYLSVNISAHQIPSQLTPEYLEDLAQRLSFEPSRLGLEITEGVLIGDVGEVQTWLEAVRDRGFLVYLDDFGTGYSSLSYLKRFRVDRLKIDKSFIRDLSNDLSDQALVQAVMSIAHSFELEVIAEGVEDPRQVRLLRDMGCRYAQGYVFSPPVAIEAFTEVSERILKLFDAIAMETLASDT